MAKVLAVIPYCPCSLRPRLRYFLDELSANYDLVIVAEESCDQLIERYPSSEIVFVKPEHMAFKIIRLIWNLLRGIPITYSYYYNPSLGKAVRKMDLSDYSLIYLKRIPFIHFMNFEINVVVDAVDCFFYQTKMYKKSSSGLKKIFYSIDSVLLPRYESLMIKCVRKVFVTTPLEKKRFENGLNLNSIDKDKLVPIFHSVDSAIIEDEIKTTYPQSNLHSSKMIVGFHGKLSYHQNILALGNLNDIFSKKHILEKWSPIIVGKYPDNYPAIYSNLKFLGYCKSLSSVYSKCKLAIFPIIKCVGIQNKVLETIGLGIPTLITYEVFETLPKTFLDDVSEHGIFVRNLVEFPDFLESYSPSSSKMTDFKNGLKRYYHENFSSSSLMGRFTNEFESCFLYADSKPPRSD